MSARIATILAHAWRAARWAESGGAPSCPDCWDGKDVAPHPGVIAANPALRAYRCAACRNYFSDTTDTALDQSRKALTLWAFLVLGGDEKTLPGAYKEQWRRLRAMRTRALESPTGQRWREELTKAGVTREQLYQAIVPMRRRTR